MNNLAGMLSDQSKYEVAEVKYQQALKLGEKVQGQGASLDSKEYE